MKFTEGYWERNERANAIYAMQAFMVEKIENGMRVTAPEHIITERSGALDVATITTEFTSVRKNIISVKSYHYNAYEKREPRFEIFADMQDVSVEINEDVATMTSGDVKVIVNRQDFSIIFEGNGRVLTQIGFRNLGYMQYDRTPMTKFPGQNYMHSDYKPYMVTELGIAPGECIYGMGERFTPFVKNGQVVDCWNEDGGTASQMAYKNIPFYISSNKYGVYVDHSDNVSFEVGSEKVENVGISVPGEEIRYHIIYGDTMKAVIESYTDLTGKPSLPPAWSFGLWLSTSFTTNYNEETTSSFIEGMEKQEIPLSVFHFDCYWMKELQWCGFEWDERIFPDVKGMLERYKAKGLKICVWINPYISQSTKAFQEARENGYLLMRNDGKGVRQLDNWQPGMGVVDFTNPKAAKWYQNKLRTLLEIGVDCFKTDFGERIPIDVTYFDNSDPDGMHNYYTYLYNKTVFDVLKEVKGGKDSVLFARSATVGCQQFPIHWGGDCSATYASMAESLRGGLSFMMSGFSYWSHDIGGFEMTATPDLYKRWLQFGLLSTHSRLHGSKSYRVPWLFDEESNDVCRVFTKLKARLMPYIYRKSVEAKKTGLPVMRPMVLEFEGDLTTKHLDMQYMLGDSILVAPILSSDSRVQYYLPEGTWTHYITGEIHTGGKWYEEEYNYFSLPLFVRENTFLARGAVEDRTDYDYTKDVAIELYQLKDKKAAKCEITDLNGEIIYIAEATRNGDEILITANKKLEGVKFIIKNGNNKDIVLKPDAKELKIVL